MEILGDRRDEAGLWILLDLVGNLPLATAPTGGYIIKLRRPLFQHF